MSAKITLPLYQCHKKVQAIKIGEIRGKCIIPEDNNYPSIRVTPQWIKRHNPHVGGYFVVYDDGYKSFSPQIAFEAGYHLITYNLQDSP